MNRDDLKYSQYLAVLNEELLPAMGCTEPVSVAYAAAVARSALVNPHSLKHCQIVVSGNIIKNAKSVVVPNTNGLKGLPAAAAAGIAAGNHNLGLQVISQLDVSAMETMNALLHDCKFDVALADTTKTFYIEIQLECTNETSRAVIEDTHTNLTLLEHNGTMLSLPASYDQRVISASYTDRSFMNVDDILNFAEQVKLTDVAALLLRQIDYNSAISEEGMRHCWGSQVGKTLKASFPQDIYMQAIASACSGSDARMSGCGLPVIIISGSGNQGLTASMPVITYAHLKGETQDHLFRALVLSNLLTIHQKTEIGRLSAFCGATSAGIGAVCGIAWLDNACHEDIKNIIRTSLGIVSGMVCDGAKASCAAKIAIALNSCLLGYKLVCNNCSFNGGDGLVSAGTDDTIHNIGLLAHDGMLETDKTILRIMANTLYPTFLKS